MKHNRREGDTYHLVHASWSETGSDNISNSYTYFILITDIIIRMIGRPLTSGGDDVGGSDVLGLFGVETPGALRDDWVCSLTHLNYYIFY